LVLSACNRDPKLASKKYVEIGNKYFSRQKFKEASILYRKALQKDLKNPEAYYRLALVDLKTRQFADAARWLQRSVQLDPNNADATAKLADLYMASYLQNPAKRKGELTEVGDLSAALLKRDQKSFNGLRLKAFLALANKDLPGAIEGFRQALSVEPNHPDLTLSLCQALESQNQSEEAKKLAENLVAAHKDFGPGYDFLYNMAVHSGNIPAAEELLKRKVENNPKDGQYRVQLAAHYFRYHQPREVTAAIDALVSSAAITDRYMLAGDFYLTTRQYDQAMAQFEKGAAAADTGKKMGYEKRRIQVLVAESKFSDAAKRVDQLIQQDPKDADAVAMRAALRMHNGSIEDIAGAIKDLQGILDKAPEGANIHQIHFNLGRAYLAKYEAEKAIADRTVMLGDLDQARIQFEQAIQYASTKLGVRFAQAKLALGQVMIYKGDNTRTMQLANDVLNNEPNDIAALMMRSAAEVNLRKFDEARTDLDAVIKARPNDRNAHYQLAMAFFLDGKYPEADEQFEWLGNAGDARGMLGLIDSKNKQEKYPESIRMIESALAKGKNEKLFRYMLASTQARAHRYDDAIGNFKILIAADPKQADLRVRLGEAYVLNGQTENAIESFKKAHELAPNEVFPVLRLGSIYQTGGRLDDARQQYEAVLKVQPNNAMALNNLAFMKAEAGVDLDQALTLAQRASQQAPDDLSIKDTLAYIYTRKGLPDEGLRILRDLVSKRPDSVSFRYHLALALFQKGDHPSARKELNSALQDKPTGDQQRKIKELMAKMG
jgi:tetratricopeptide (TPR) repeat protein